MPLETSYRYLNADGRWPAAVGDLVIDASGMLRLAPAPADATPLVEVAIDPAGGLVGLAAARAGTLYLCDPGGGRVLRVDPSDGTVAVLGCLEAASGDPLAAQRPRGLALVGARTLVVADAGAGRLLALDRLTGVLSEVREDFDAPWDVAVDSRGRLVVCDARAATVRRFEPGAGEDLGFAAEVAALAQPLVAPRALAVLPGERLAVVDGGAPTRVVVLSDDGSADEDAGAALQPLDPDEVTALVHDGTTLWAAGGAGTFALTAGTLARGGPPGAAGVASDRQGRILVATAQGISMLAPGGAVASGAMVMAAPEWLLPWDRVRVLPAEPLPGGAHVRVWTRTQARDDPDPGPPPPGDGPDAQQPTPAGTWRAAPLDVLDLRPLCAPAEVLWIALELSGDGAGTPVVDDVRVDRMGRGWTDLLPRVVVPDDPDPLERLLALLTSVYEDTAAAIDALVERLDPHATPDRPGGWLERLAAWVSIALPLRLSGTERRELVAGALAIHERRGTVRGIVEAVRREAGIDVEVVEPDPPAAWGLGAGGLAFDSALPPSPAGPAVLDTTAIVDRSWLIDPGERGLPLLGGQAHRFCVVAAAADLEDPDVRAAVVRVVEREKPAATVFELRGREARTVVGAQSRVGVDALTGPSRHGPAPGRVGMTTFIGDPDSERTVFGNE